MRPKTVLSFVSLFVVLFTVSVWAGPFPPGERPRLDSASANQTASGKISTVSDTSFSLEVKKSEGTQTVQFLIAENTKVQGKLEAGAQATVEFRTDGGRNIALNVIVQPAQGFSN